MAKFSISAASAEAVLRRKTHNSVTHFMMQKDCRNREVAKFIGTLVTAFPALNMDSFIPNYFSNISEKYFN